MAERRRIAKEPAGEIAEITIEALGGRGDGIGRLRGKPVFVALALPGERLRVRIAGRRGDGLVGEPLARLSEVPRAEPPCPHFGACGGCRLQHLPRADYANWIVAQIRAALARHGLKGVPIEPPLIVPPASRRRARFAFARRAGRVRLGLRARASHEIVDLTVCPVVVPEIEALLPPLRNLLGRLRPGMQVGEAQVTRAVSGLDLLLRTSSAPALADREQLAAFADEFDLARLCWQAEVGGVPEPVVVRRQVLLAFEGVQVALPPGAFLQAGSEAEAGIRAAVGSAIGDAAHVADLFAGCGTFALPLARAGRRVLALERDGAMVDALLAAARAAGLGARLDAGRRDLERRPLAGAELDGFEAVVLDPPRAGARAQAEALAGSAVPRIAIASCNPSTFARDARILVEGGFDLLWVRPVDAFLWSAELEVVAALRRPLGP
jgi:23S rRNA (uracil1939-C5)-methyltransferase